jgi:guanine deaminase
MSDKDYLKLAVEQAKKSVTEGGFPAGAVIVKDEKVISEGVALGNILHDPTEHPETSSIRNACKILNTTNLDGCVLYGSLECCNMCFSVANWAGITKVVYGCRKTSEMVNKQYYEGLTENKTINESNNRKIEIVFIPDLEQECLDLVKEWEEKII